MSRPPKLDEEILDDRDALGNAIDKVLVKSKSVACLSKQLRRRQRELRRLVRDPAWRVYLRIEETTNERTIIETELLVRWAFRAGLRARRRTSRPKA